MQYSPKAYVQDEQVNIFEVKCFYSIFFFIIIIFFLQYNSITKVSIHMSEQSVTLD